MKTLHAAVVFGFGMCIAEKVYSQVAISLSDRAKLAPVGVTAASDTYMGKKSLKVTGTTTDNQDQEQFLKLNGTTFHNGNIEIELAGRPGAGASETARGFVGIAFRISDDNKKFECIYLRPTNGRAEDQTRRNHSVQYVSVPDYPWFKLRKETPEKYESYVDLVAGEWTKVRIEVRGARAKLFVHGATQPTLIVNDLKLGDNVSGGVGLWIGPGTDAHFTDPVITKID